MKNKTGYSPQNLTDRIKQKHFSDFLKEILNTVNLKQNKQETTDPDDVFKYFDLFAGAGIYNRGTDNEFKGAAILALEMISNSGRDFHAYLNEKNSALREELRANVQPYGNKVDVFETYQDYIDEYISLADEDSLFFIDPTHLADYEGEKGVLAYLTDILTTKAKLYLYAPESVGIKQFADHRKTIEQIIQTVKASGREFAHFVSEKNNTRGYLKRADHNIMVY
ncbi:MAG TPA: hypothetical protein ENF94_01260 [Candidatus Woesearchaeota archaeon]|nr:MAG: hypothetical protein DRJ25_03195 [Candidatus Woesearchaeota archaeon]HDD70769.1 hypothetical protein [Candidatus Woesearchaeota archaeon]